MLRLVNDVTSAALSPASTTTSTEASTAGAASSTPNDDDDDKWRDQLVKAARKKCLKHVNLANEIPEITDFIATKIGVEGQSYCLDEFLFICLFQKFEPG